MSYYRKKPVIIEAKEWGGLAVEATPIINWILDNGGTARFHSEPSNLLMINTLEGVMRADPGDFIIRGTEGEFYPCKPAAFAATFEPINVWPDA